jgi:isoleucyl-tRNA synthetase
MAEVLDIVVLGRAARNLSGIKNRQPISEMYVSGANELNEFYKEIIEDELNVKKVTFKEDVSDLTSYSFKPQLRLLGPKYGKQLGKISKALATIDGSAAKKQLDTEGILTIELDSDKIDLTPEELLVSMTQKEGFVSQADRGITVVLDTNLTPELIEEGFVREIISKIQTMRKEAGFEVTDHIEICAEGNDRIEKVMTDNADVIKKDVLADDISFDSAKGYSKDWNINGEKVRLYVNRK